MYTHIYIYNIYIYILYIYIYIYIYISSSSPFPTRWGQRPEFLISRMFCPAHLPGMVRSVCISVRMPSIHLPLGLPLGLFPGTLMSPTALTSFSSILCMCPYQHSLISLTFSCMLLTSSSFLMSTLFTLSLNVTPFILLELHECTHTHTRVRACVYIRVIHNLFCKIKYSVFLIKPFCKIKHFSVCS